MGANLLTFFILAAVFLVLVFWVAVRLRSPRRREEEPTAPAPPERSLADAPAPRPEIEADIVAAAETERSEAIHPETSATSAIPPEPAPESAAPVEMHPEPQPEPRVEQEPRAAIEVGTKPADLGTEGLLASEEFEASDQRSLGGLECLRLESRRQAVGGDAAETRVVPVRGGQPDRAFAIAGIDALGIALPARAPPAIAHALGDLART